MMKKAIWKSEGFCGGKTANHNYLIPIHEIEHKILLMDNSILIKNIGVEGFDLEKLAEQYSEQATHQHELYGADLTDLIIFFEKLGYQNAVITKADWYENPGEFLIFDTQERKFFYSETAIKVDIYSYWDGNDLQTIEKHDEVTETIVKYSADYICIDEWDTKLTFKCTGGIGLHQYVHKVFEVDSDKVEDTYSVEFYSEWTDTHESAVIMSAAELESHLESLNRGVSSYMDELKEF